MLFDIMIDITKRETLFTKIVEKEIPSWVVYEDDKHLAFLNIFPFEKGHTLVIPKKPYETIMEMPEDEYLDLQKIVLKVSKHLKIDLKCDISIAQKNGKIGEQDIPHVHVHVIPRRDSSKKFYNEKRPDKYLGNEMDNYRNKLKF